MTGPRRLLPMRGGAFAVLLALAAGGSLTACSPAVTVASLLISTITQDTASAAPQTGPFSGARSPVQNRTDPDPGIARALDMDRNVSPACKALLPEEAAEPLTACALRPVCLPGSQQPITLRLCPAPDMAASSQATAQPATRRTRPAAWQAFAAE